MVFPKKYKASLIGWYFQHEDWKRSGEAWRYANEQIAPETISRGSIINFLRLCREEGYLESKEMTWKGGMTECYRATMGINGFWKYVSETINAKLAPFLKGQA